MVNFVLHEVLDARRESEVIIYIVYCIRRRRRGSLRLEATEPALI